MNWVDNLTKIRKKDDNIEKVIVKLYNQDVFLKSIIIPTEYYPLPSGKIKTFDYRNTDFLYDEKIKDAFDETEYVAGQCWDNCLKMGEELQKRNIKFQYYGGWLFVSNLIPVFHAWIVCDGNILDLSNMNEKFQEEMKRGRTEEDVIRFHSHVKAVKNSERCNIGKVYEDLFYVGVPMKPLEAKCYYQNLMKKYPRHESGANLSQETGLNKTQTLLKENNLL